MQGRVVMTIFACFSDYKGFCFTVSMNDVINKKCFTLAWYK